MRCRVPGVMKEFLTVVSWTRDDGLVIVPHKNPGAKYLLLKDGELHIRNTDASDNMRKYRCQIKNQLTGHITFSVSAGRLIITDSAGSVPPRITSGSTTVHVREGHTAEMPCTAQGYPLPSYRWFRIENGQMLPLHLSGRMIQFNGTLFIEKAMSQDRAKYVCIVNNSVGQERMETELIVYGNLSVNLHPSHLRTEPRRSATLNCSVHGSPIHSITWTKDMKPVITNNRVRLIGNQILHITDVHREDQGMYQCFVYGGSQAVQSAAQITLSGPYFFHTALKKL